MTTVQSETATHGVGENTNRELWREIEGDYYAPKIFVTATGGIGMDVAGTVHVMPIREWHALAASPPPPSTEVGELVEAWKWRAKVKGEWGLWSVVEVDPNDWTWREYWEVLEVVPLVSATLLQSQAAALAEARREISEASRYLDGLLRSYVGKYCYPVPEWQPLPDLIGMLTQIDNASTVTAQFEARANDAEASLATMREALEPFASFARNNTDDDGWAGTQCQRERIVDWFGPSDFIDARRALGGSIGIPLMTERVPASQGAAQDD